MKLALGNKNNNLLIIDVATGLFIFSKTMKSSISSLKWKEFLLVLGCDDGNIFVWDITEVKLLCEVKNAHSGKILLSFFLSQS